MLENVPSVLGRFRRFLHILQNPSSDLMHPHSQKHRQVVFTSGKARVSRGLRLRPSERKGRVRICTAWCTSPRLVVFLFT